MILVEYCCHGNLSMYLRRMRDRYVGSHSDANLDDGDMKKNRLHSDDSADDGAFLMEGEDAEKLSWAENNRISRTSCDSEEDTIGFNESDACTTENTPFSR